MERLVELMQSHGLEWRVELVHASATTRVVRVTALRGERVLGSCLGEAADAEQAEDRALSRLLARLAGAPAASLPPLAPSDASPGDAAGAGVGSASDAPSGLPSRTVAPVRRPRSEGQAPRTDTAVAQRPPADPVAPASAASPEAGPAGPPAVVQGSTRSSSGHPVGSVAASPGAECPGKVSSSPAGPSEPLSPPAMQPDGADGPEAGRRPEPGPAALPDTDQGAQAQEPPADPDDWSQELSGLERQLQRLGWGREQEAVFLERGFGHPSRSRLTTYADLMAYLRALEGLEAGADPATAMVPLRRRDLLRLCDELLDALRWTAEQGRQVLQQQFGLTSRQQLSEAQLLQFNLLLEAELMAVQPGEAAAGAAASADPVALPT